ncbi:MAG: DUF4139 domain-containing protein [Campylobacteraceae bacterium]|nr:DUF4139 domain-containing protein [Campylobacteraceae bacterium]
MRYIIVFIAISLPLLAQQRLLEIYTDRSYLTERFDVGSGPFETNVPEFVTLESLQIKSPCAIKEKSLGKPIILQNYLQARIEEAEAALKETKLALSALEAKERLLERTTINANSMQNIANEADSFSFYMKQILNDKEILKKEVENAQKIFDELKDSGNNSVRTLNLSLACGAPSLLELHYPLKNLIFNRNATLAGDKESGVLKIDQSLFIKHQLGVNLENLTLNLYGFAYSDRLAPPTFNPWYIDAPEPILMRSVMLKAADMTNESLQQAPSSTQKGEGKHFWEVSGLNLPNNESIQIPLNSQQVFSNFAIFIDGYAESFAYTQVRFTPEAFVEAASAELILGGMLLGKQNIHRLNAKKESILFFGKNEHIDVEKILRKDFTTQQASSNTQTSQILWEYTITNRDTKPHKLTLSERLPISKDGEIFVELLGDKPDSSDAKGEQRYLLTLQEGETKIINFGYSITKPLPKK